MSWHGPRGKWISSFSSSYAGPASFHRRHALPSTLSILRILLLLCGYHIDPLEDHDALFLYTRSLWCSGPPRPPNAARVEDGPVCIFFLLILLSQDSSCFCVCFPHQVFASSSSFLDAVGKSFPSHDTCHIRQNLSSRTRSFHSRFTWLANTTTTTQLRFCFLPGRRDQLLELSHMRL